MAVPPTSGAGRWQGALPPTENEGLVLRSDRPFALVVWGAMSQAWGDGWCYLATSLLAEILHPEGLLPIAPSCVPPVQAVPPPPRPLKKD